MMKFKTAISIDESTCQEMIMMACTNEWKKVSSVVCDVVLEIYDRYGKIEGDIALEERIKYLYTISLLDIDDPSQPYGIYHVKLTGNECKTINGMFYVPKKSCSSFKLKPLCN